MATPTHEWEHNYSKPEPEHNYSKNRRDDDAMDDGHDTGQIKVASIRLYFEGLKSASEEEQAWEEMSEFLEDEAGSRTRQLGNHRQNPIQDTSGSMETGDQGDTAESEKLYAVELKTYATVGGILKPMMVTVLNVAAMSLKCLKCMAPFEKQLSSDSLNCLESHTCGSHSVNVEPSTKFGPDPSGISQKTASGTSIPEEKTTTMLSVQNKKYPERANRPTIPDEKAMKTHSGQTSKVWDRANGPNILDGKHCAENMDDVDDNGDDSANEDELNYTEDTGEEDNPKSETSVVQKQEDQVDQVDREYLKHALNSQERREKYNCVLCRYKVKHRCIKLWKKEHKCPTCNKVFKLKSGLDSHVSIHTGEKPHKCPTCGKGFRLPHSVTEHMQIHGGEKKFLCHICGFKFLRHGDQLAHIRRHNDQYPFRCGECNKGFKSKHGLKVHMIRHTGEKPFLCPICGQTLCQITSFRSHMRLHEIAENPSRCTDCNITYQDLDELRLHSCSAGKRHLCTVCGKSFVYGLQTHMKSHVRPKPSTCKSCKQIFPNELELRMHEDEHIVKCSDCGETIKEAKSCMLNNLPGSADLKKVKKFKCWSCHSNRKIIPEFQDLNDEDVLMTTEEL